MHIRKARPDDLSTIMGIYSIAQDFMAESGNPTQWKHSYPKRELIEKDIESEACHLICNDDEVHGMFVLISGDEPSYQYIEDGQWLNDESYITVHRIASDQKQRGIFNCAIDYCKTISDNIRIDTHKNNIIMQKLIERNGFEKCGTIYVRDGSARIAYQWSKY